MAAVGCGDDDSIDPGVDASIRMDSGTDSGQGGEDSGPPDDEDAGDTDAGQIELPEYCPEIAAPPAPPSCPANPTEVVVAGGDLAGANWTCANTYRLTGNVFVTSGVLSIGAGTRIVGDMDGALIVTPGARIDAQGHPDAPIVFTSSRAAGARNRGDWGGIVLLGNAPINVTGGTDNIEGIEAADTRGVYGGTAAAHDCGTMRYTRIEYAGRAIGVGNELNGLTLGGCGSDTDIEFVQMHRGSDDAFEIFGGSPNLRYLVASGMEDDGLDWDQGFVGRVQFMVIHRFSDAGTGDPNGIEADNLNGSNDATPRSNPTVFNLTIVTTDATRANQVGAVLRRGTYGTIRNSIVQGFPLAVDVRDAAGEAAAGTMLTFNNSVFYDNDADFTAGSAEATAFSAAGAMNRVGMNPMLTAVSDTAPDYSPADESIVATGGATPPAGFATNATYVGAIGPECPDWTEGWTAFPVQ
ncbi:hypothetical protein [Sandaracinus amylolyticus]|uniref:hypothetical protein n=1 Tax=Sandaracinus amylolyticus TaxID=927083 RepID=UPI001F31EDF9|nr:hypothetical protein [Sandaracinus amylolyticus]UJR82510.1 Hypothetical protein I5071_45750 [Sandaracinus amylolyticus]